MVTYIERTKNKVRHQYIKQAVEYLTLDRKNSTVIPRDYVRNVYDYFFYKDELSDKKDEVDSIDVKYISDWERLHEVLIGEKKVEDLTVCYLCGPEPNNDFNEFLNLGILPHNIWAFEIDKNTYNQAIKSYEGYGYPQPKIIRQNLETFFKNTPKKFDVIYLDACGAIPSNKHILKCIRELFMNVRLESPGVLISNCATPSIEKDIDEYVDLISLYFYFKDETSKEIQLENGKISNFEFIDLKENVKKNFDLYYGNFVSSIIRDLACIIVPVQRIKDNTYFNQLFSDKKRHLSYQEMYKLANNNSFAKFILSIKYMKDQKIVFNDKIELFLNEIGGFDSILYGVDFIIKIQNNLLIPDQSIMETINYFNENKVFQFLDKVHVNMFIDIVIFQLTFPMHYNLRQNNRNFYTSKSTKMMIDIIGFDECRYIYEWLPAMHQIKSAFANKSWQYVFRFALDGLVKSRKQYNNELFFQGSVVSDSVDEFKCYQVPLRTEIK